MACSLCQGMTKAWKEMKKLFVQVTQAWPGPQRWQLGWVNLLGAVQVPQQGLKKGSWAQIIAQQLENSSFSPHQPFQLKKGLSPPFLTSQYVKKIIFQPLSTLLTAFTPYKC